MTALPLCSQKEGHQPNLFWTITADYDDSGLLYAWRTVCHQNHTLLERLHRSPPKPIVGCHKPQPHSPNLNGLSVWRGVMNLESLTGAATLREALTLTT